MITMIIIFHYGLLDINWFLWCVNASNSLQMFFVQKSDGECRRIHSFKMFPENVKLDFYTYRQFWSRNNPVYSCVKSTHKPHALNYSPLEKTSLCSLNLQEINRWSCFFPPEAAVHKPKFSSPGKDSLQKEEKIFQKV